jgi:S1-C subfamily serine protease
VYPPLPPSLDGDARRAPSSSSAFLGVLTSPSSTRVTGVMPSSPAATAGIRPGDVIEAIGGQDVEHPETLFRLLRDRRPGERVALVFSRDGQRIQVRVALGGRR